MVRRMNIQLISDSEIKLVWVKNCGLMIPRITSTRVTTDRIINTDQILLVEECSECAVVFAIAL